MNFLDQKTSHFKADFGHLRGIVQKTSHAVSFFTPFSAPIANKQPIPSELSLVLLVLSIVLCFSYNLRLMDGAVPTSRILQVGIPS